jgi:hypothetical protein
MGSHFLWAVSQGTANGEFTQRGRRLSPTGQITHRKESRMQLGMIGLDEFKREGVDDQALVARTLTRAESTTQIARRLREWVDVFEAGRLSHRPGTA